MPETLQRRHDPIIQFAVFMENKLGRLHDLIRVLYENQVHVMAMTVLDTTDSSILRIIVDDHERARTILRRSSFHFNESPVLVLEMNSSADIHRALCALLEAEINIHYTYAFITRPNDKCALALSVEDPDVAGHALSQCGFHILTRDDITR
jgi:hypothetical protein